MIITNLIKASVLIMSMWSVCRNTPATIELPLEPRTDFRPVINFPGAEVHLGCSVEDYSSVHLFMSLKADSLGLFYPHNMEIFLNSEKIAYSYKTDDKHTGDSIFVIDNFQRHFLFETTSVDVGKTDEIRISADRFLSIGKDYYDLDTLTFSVAKGRRFLYK